MLIECCVRFKKIMGWFSSPLLSMPTFFSDSIGDFLFFFERLDWLSIIDILLVASMFFVLLHILRDTQAMALLRGGLFLVVFVVFLASLLDLPAFSWLINTTLPALLFAIPVIFAPEIRRTLERIGRAGTFIPKNARNEEAMLNNTVDAMLSAIARLSARQHGALIVLERLDSLEEFIETGVWMDAEVTPEVLLQIFYPNTPLHDGAVIISDFRIAAASTIMPLSSSGILARSPEREMGLRHRAALGISENSDALSLVVSEETGDISIAQSGRILRKLDLDRVKNILLAFYHPQDIASKGVGFVERLFSSLFARQREKAE